MKIKNKLALYSSYIDHDQGSTEPVSNKTAVHKPEIPMEGDWRKQGVYPYFMDAQYCMIKESRYPLTEKRGIYAFSDYLRAVDAWQNTEITHPLSAKGYEPNNLFFFDTETTGLGGGTGNTIFLLGYAYVEGNDVVVKQHFLPEPGFEIPLYDSFLRNIDYTTLVTYNGKAFDWPQVKTRHTLIREHVPKLPPFGHFDLLHASRRLWKNRLDGVSLANVEKDILQIHRDGDVPGFLAPIIYFDYVDTKKPDGILEVMRHNEEDVLSLIILYTHLTFQLLGLDKEQSKSEKILVGKWYSSLQETDAAIHLLESSVNSFEGREKWDGMYELALQYKKTKQYRQAVSYFKQIADGSKGRLKINACIEAAKILEHQFKNFSTSLKYTHNAFQELETAERITGEKKLKLKQELKKRMTRLERKQMKMGLNRLNPEEMIDE